MKSFGKKGTGDGEFRNPTSVCMDNKGHVVVTEIGNNRIQVLTKDGVPVFKFGDRAPTLNRPLGCVYHNDVYCIRQRQPLLESLRRVGEIFTQDWRRRRGRWAVKNALGFVRGQI